MTEIPLNDDWVGPEDEADPEDEVVATEYDILSSPNDWNVLTIGNYMESGSIEIPYFQRNYVWDMKRASRLIESLIIGLPVPQIFLYEKARNKYLVIDGQQRLLTIYFFLKGRFPRPSRRGHLRTLLQAEGLNEAALADDKLFQDFKLNLASPESGTRSKFHQLKYSQLDDYRPTFDLRTLRNVIVKQLSPKGDDAMYEIFNRLNTGGVNLSPQEIRASLYRSHLIELINDLNADSNWRELLGRPEPDNRMQDVEILLRAAALAMRSTSYTSPMTSYVNRFCIEAMAWPASTSEETVRNLRSAIDTCRTAGPEAFQRLGKFSPLLFEAVVSQVWGDEKAKLKASSISSLARDDEFTASMQEGSTKTSNVQRRLQAAARHLS